MPSFDIVSETDLNEVDNAIAGMQREIATRYDFKGSKCSIERKEAVLTIVADDDLKLRQMHELLSTYLTRRRIEASACDLGTPKNAAGNTVRQLVTINQRIGHEVPKRIVKELQGSKLKDQATSQGHHPRIPSKNRDHLQ